MAAEAAAVAAENALVGEEREIRRVFEWIGFTTATQRQRISDESFIDYADVLAAKEGDILPLAESFQKRTPAAQRIVFGQRRNKKTPGLYILGS